MTTETGREAWRMMHELLLAGQALGRMNEVRAAMGISPGLVRTLIVLQPGEGVAMRKLADRLRCDASYVTGLADALEERGLAERRRHPTDRRVKMIVLTTEGVAARERVLEALSEPPASFGVLTASEQHQLRDLLGKVADAAPDLARGRARPR